MLRRTWLGLLLLILIGQRAAAAVSAPPPGLRASHGLAALYTKHLSVEGLPVLGSAKVQDAALEEAAHLIRRMIGHRPDILRAIAQARVRVVVMATTEMTTDVPEHSDLTPRPYWDRRARGLGATPARPAVSCGEENLLDLSGDPYAAENILVHEFAHVIHEIGLAKLDPTFDQRLTAAFAGARAKGLWKGTYASQNRSEYWAEAAQSWFDCNRANDEEHGPVDSRDKLKAYDPAITRLLEEVFGDRAWRYAKPGKRAPGERTHLAGFDPARGPSFTWPARAPAGDAERTPLAWLTPDRVPDASPATADETSVAFRNHRNQLVSLYWIDFQGKRIHYSDVRPGLTQVQSTFRGHVWVICEGQTVLGAVAATAAAGRADIR